MFKKISAKAE